MAWRLDKCVVRGEIDNRVRGRVDGKIWLCGRAEPVVLRLKGNGWRDVAGCLFRFSNPAPETDGEHTDLATEQVGAIGDYTASRKVRVFDVPLDEALAMSRRGEKPPEHMGNALYLEWFSERNGRVVIESADYKLEIVETCWSMSAEEEEEQCKLNAQEMTGFMKRMTDAFDAMQDADEDEEE